MAALPLTQTICLGFTPISYGSQTFLLESNKFILTVKPFGCTASISGDIGLELTDCPAVSPTS